MEYIIWDDPYTRAGRSPQNLCRRVVISNAFAAKKIEDDRFSIEL